MYNFVIHSKGKIKTDTGRGASRHILRSELQTESASDNLCTFG